PLLNKKRTVRKALTLFKQSITLTITNEQISIPASLKTRTLRLLPSAIHVYHDADRNRRNPYLLPFRTSLLHTANRTAHRSACRLVWRQELQVRRQYQVRPYLPSRKQDPLYQKAPPSHSRLQTPRHDDGNPLM